MPCGICDKMKVVYRKMTHDGVKLKVVNVKASELCGNLLTIAFSFM